MAQGDLVWLQIMKLEFNSNNNKHNFHSTSLIYSYKQNLNMPMSLISHSIIPTLQIRKLKCYKIKLPVYTKTADVNYCYTRSKRI